MIYTFTLQRGMKCLYLPCPRSHTANPRASALTSKIKTHRFLRFGDSCNTMVVGMTYMCVHACKYLSVCILVQHCDIRDLPPSTRNQVKPVQPSAITASSNMSQGQFSSLFFFFGGGGVTLTLASKQINVPSSSILLNVGSVSTTAHAPLHLCQKELELPTPGRRVTVSNISLISLTHRHWAFHRQCFGASFSCLTDKGQQITGIR